MHGNKVQFHDQTLVTQYRLFNSLPNDKFQDLLKLKAFAEDKTNVAEKLTFVFGRVENIVGKGENAGHQHFLLFPQCFQVFFFRVIISRDRMVKG